MVKFVKQFFGRKTDSETEVYSLNGFSKDILNNYVSGYKRLFSTFYPSLNSTGFTERNLTVRYCEAYAKQHPDSLVWYEFPFGENCNLHLDAIIFEPQSGELVLIESKRLKNSRKIRSVGNDVNRIQQVSDRIEAELDGRLDASKVKTVTGLILADVWITSKRGVKNSLLESFQKECFVEEFQDHLQLSFEMEPSYFAYSFSDIGTVKAYNLLGLTWKARSFAER